MSVQLTQARVREILVIPPETMRHWRKVLPCLAQRRRHSKMSAGDLVALAVIRDLVRAVGISSSTIAPYSESLFAACNSAPWHLLAQMRVQVEGSLAKLVPMRSTAPIAKGPVIVVRLDHVVDELVRKLGGRSAEQIELNFPLTSVSGRKR